MKQIIFLTVILFLVPSLAGAIEVQTFTNLPWLDGQSLTTEAYVSALYKIAIAVGSILAVGMLLWAGTEYMFSDLITTKAKAKNRIKNALLGLLIILGAVTLLNTINPNLTKLNVIGQGGTVSIKTTQEQGLLGLPDEALKGFVKGTTFDGLKIYEGCGGGVGGAPKPSCEAANEEKLQSLCEEDGGVFSKSVQDSGLTITFEKWVVYNYSCD